MLLGGGGVGGAFPRLLGVEILEYDRELYNRNSFGYLVFSKIKCDFRGVQTVSARVLMGIVDRITICQLD